MNEITPPLAPTGGLETVKVETSDGRVYTGSGGDEASTKAAVEQTSFAKPVDPATAETREADGRFKPKEKKGRARFEELTNSRTTAERERDEAVARAKANEDELTKLKAQLEAREKPVETKPVETEAKPVETKAEEKKRLRLQEFAEKNPETFVEDYVEAAIQERLQEALDAKLNERLAADRALTVVQTAVAESAERGREIYPDFQAKLDSSTVSFPGIILESIARAPGSEHIQYALASDPALAERIAKMANDKGQILDPVALGVELGRLGAVDSRARIPASREPVATSKAPAPVQPVVGGSRTATKTLDEIAATGSYDDYKRARHAAMGVSAR